MSTILLFIWITLYILFPYCRQPMFWTSWTFAAGGPISEYWHYWDYWHPPYIIDIIIGNWHFGIEDYITAFAVVGISAALFEIMALKSGLTVSPKFSAKTYFKLKLWGVIGVGIIFIAVFIGLNSVVAIILTFVILSLAMQGRNWKIFLFAIVNAIIFTSFYWLYYLIFFTQIFPNAIETYWKLSNTWGIMLTGVPIEEFIWAFFACLFAGPVYRVCSTKTLFGKY